MSQFLSSLFCFQSLRFKRHSRWLFSRHPLPALRILAFRQKPPKTLINFDRFHQPRKRLWLKFNIFKLGLRPLNYRILLLPRNFLKVKCIKAILQSFMKAFLQQHPKVSLLKRTAFVVDYSSILSPSFSLRYPLFLLIQGKGQKRSKVTPIFLILLF